MSLTAIEIETARPYRVRVGPDALAEAEHEVGSRTVAVLTDTNVGPLHLQRLGKLATGAVLAVEPGEPSKSFGTLERVLDFLAAANLDRSSYLVTLGGGVIGDLGGLAAALYMRGIDVVQCPTTLLAQVDASVGGKTAVNLAAGKNLAGAFHQPAAVLADVQTLETLSADEYRCGLGEVAKTALLGDADLFELLERETASLIAREPDVVTEVVVRCVRIKGRIVAQDEHEGGLRKALNLGHTFAHAIEHVAGYGVVPHGIAVGTGLCLAARASAGAGHLAHPELVRRIEALLAGLGLAPTLAGLRERYGIELPAAALIEGMRLDKKGLAGAPAFVLPTDLGRVRVDEPLDKALLADILA